MYRGIPGAARVAEISKASAEYLSVQRAEGPFGVHSGNQQLFIKHPLCARSSFGWIPPACLYYERHTDDFPYHK